MKSGTTLGWNDELEFQSGNAQFRSKLSIFRSVWPNLMDELEKQQGTSYMLICHSKLCTSFCSHLSIKTGVTIWKRSMRVKIFDFSDPVTLKFDRWPWTTITHIFYATSSFVYYFKPICEFKQTLQSGNAQIGTKFVSTPVTKTFDIDVLHGHHVCQQ